MASIRELLGFAPITSSSASPSFMNATIDMTEVYKGAVSKANRGVAIVDQKYVLIQDEVEALIQPLLSDGQC
jgi:predicted ATP-dependent protease